jgi:hypothetical protein
MKLTYDQTNDRKELNELVHLIVKSFAGQEFSGMQMWQKVNKIFGIDIDHHEFTYMMDSMTRTGEATCTQGWGDTRYRIFCDDEVIAFRKAMGL